jgi:zinc protease
MNRRSLGFLGGAAGVLFAAAVFAAPPSTSDPRAAASSTSTAAGRDPTVLALERLALSIQRTTLENGLRVVLNTDPSSPTVAVSVTYDVGSRNEGPGQSGFAHLFEHMMFQGSKNVKKGEHFSLISERGGTLNGTTSADRTNYFEAMPSSELALALYLEADRMRWLNVNAENFENQRAVVQEEYRMRVENAPYARGMLRLGEIAFSDYPPYAHSTIGSMEDLARAQLSWVQEFYQRHYAPNNAVLTIAGDFDPDRALELVRQYFGPAERREIPPFKVEPPTTPSPGKREVVEDKNANTPGIGWAYRIPPFRTKEHYALELAALLLADGESSRLYTKLVREQAVLQSVSAWTDDRRGPDEIVLFGVLTEKAKVADVERAFTEAIERLRKTPPHAVELQRVKNRLKHDFAFGLQSNLRRAVKLGEYEVYFGDARLLTRDLQSYLDVTAEDVQRAAAQYLLPELRYVIEVKPAVRAPEVKP